MITQTMIYRLCGLEVIDEVVSRITPELTLCEYYLCLEDIYFWDILYRQKYVMQNIIRFRCDYYEDGILPSGQLIRRSVMVFSVKYEQFFQLDSGLDITQLAL